MKTLSPGQSITVKLAQAPSCAPTATLRVWSHPNGAYDNWVLEASVAGDTLTIGLPSTMTPTNSPGYLPSGVGHVILTGCDGCCPEQFPVNTVRCPPSRMEGVHRATGGDPAIQTMEPSPSNPWPNPSC